jgi:hypothetical protein
MVTPRIVLASAVALSILVSCHHRSPSSHCTFEEYEHGYENEFRCTTTAAPPADEEVSAVHEAFAVDRKAIGMWPIDSLTVTRIAFCNPTPGPRFARIVMNGKVRKVVDLDYEQGAYLLKREVDFFRGPQAGAPSAYSSQGIIVTYDYCAKVQKIVYHGPDKALKKQVEASLGVALATLRSWGYLNERKA